MTYKKLGSMVFQEYQNLMWGKEGREKNEKLEGTFLPNDPVMGHRWFNSGVEAVIKAIEKATAEREKITVEDIKKELEAYFRSK